MLIDNVKMSSERGKFAKEMYLASFLYDAIDDEDLSFVINFLQTKAVNCNLILPKKGISPFHLVVGKESLEFAYSATALLLQHGADPNVRNEDGLTPLHITAAYGRIKILNLLLCSGGDPDLRDDNGKKPIHYAHEYEHQDCVDLLSTYMDGQRHKLFFRNDDRLSYDLTLEKIVVNTAANMGPYELIQEYKTDPTDENLQSIKHLPETDSTELVINWCKSNLSEHPQNKTIEYPESFKVSSEAESSFNESENERSVTFNKPFVTFRKKYTKTRKTNRNNSLNKLQDFKTPVCNDPLNKVTNTTKVIDISDLTEFATCSSTKIDMSWKESGIVTLPNSVKDFIALPGDSFTVSSAPLSNTITIENKENISRNSNYFTPEPTDNTLERNVFEITEDLSSDLERFDIEVWKNLRQSTKIDFPGVIDSEEKSRRFSAKSASSTGSSELSFRSVSEVYKYIDSQEDIVLYEKRLIKATTSDYAGSLISSSMSNLSSVPASVDYDTDTLRKELTSHGYNPGPITFTTKRVYLRKLMQIRKNPVPVSTNKENTKKTYSVELERTLRDPNWLKDGALYKNLEETLSKEFANPGHDRKWREGLSKTSFTYLLLDPRITDNLPCRTDQLDSKELWETFLSSIFYVGKGKRSRPYSHLYDAVHLWRDGKRSSPNKKLNHILNIWSDNVGVVCLHVFQNVIPVEAYTREASMIHALKIENLRNEKVGDFYGIAATWNQRQKKLLGVYLLYRAMMIFLNEGERQLCPNDIE